MRHVSINRRKIGADQPPYLVAEISANHNGQLDRALAIMSAAQQAGAHAIKLQTYTPDTITLDCDKADFLIDAGPWQGYKLYDLYQQAHTPYEWHKTLFDHARKLDITCFSSPFDESAVDLLEDLNAPAYKIASFEAIDIALIKYVASTGKPMIISTGMANLTEIQEAVAAALDNGCSELILLHCISAYPAPIADSNLRTLQDLANKFPVVVGLSDHTLGTTAAVTAVALGACFIEKHFTLSRQEPGPDAAFSLQPDEFKFLCQASEDAWLALGQAGYEQKACEKINAQFRRSLYFVADLKKGDTVTTKNMRSIRPGFGLAPKHYQDIIGKTLLKDVARGSPVAWQDISS
ncbi:MAG: pseudaminic acid synthase [Bermanella sp.]